MNWLEFLLIIPNFIAVVLSGAVGLYIWQRRELDRLHFFPLLSLGVVVWALGDMLSLLSTSLETKIFWARFATWGINFLPVIWLALVLGFAGYWQRLPLYLRLLIALEALINQILIWGKFPLSPNINLVEDGLLPVLVFEHSLESWFHVAFSYALVLAGIFLLIQQLSKSHSLNPGKVRALLVGVSVPWFFYMLEIVGLNLIPYIDLTPLVFALAQTWFVLAILRYNLSQVLAISSIAAAETIPAAAETMPKGLLNLGIQDRAIDDHIFSATLSAAPEHFHILDRRGRFVYASTAALQILGLHWDQVIGKTWRDLGLPTAIEESFEARTMRVFEKGIIDISDTYLPGAQEGRQYEHTLRPFRDEEGKIVLVVSTIHDITDQMQIKNALRKSEDRYFSVITAMQEGIIVQNANGNIIASNPSAERILGLTQEQIMERTSVDTRWLAIREDQSPFPSAEHPATITLRTGKAQSNVIMGLHKPDRSLAWISINSQPLFEKTENQPYAVVMSFVDITKRKHTELALRDSEKRFRSLLEFAPVAIIIVDQDRHIQLANVKAEEIFGYEQEELLGLPIEMLLPEGQRPQHIKNRQDYLDRPYSRPMGIGLDLVGLHKDGSVFPVEVGLNTIETAQGPLVMTYLLDISDRKSDEDALRQANEQLSFSLAELERHNQELTLLNEMSDMLQSCSKVSEAHAVVAEFAPRLFPNHSGALYTVSKSRNLVEAVARWGINPPNELIFQPEACWALRRGRIHRAIDADSSLHCQHELSEETPINYAYMCVPMQAQGEVIALLHIRCPGKHVKLESEHLVISVTDHITMSLSNLVLRERLRAQSIQDPLTGLYNRRHMQEYLERELRRASRHKRPLGIIMLDIDHFKEFNDQYGHEAGDLLLKEISIFLQDSVRGEDIACRYGGEEFTLILPDTSREASHNLARRIWQRAKHLRVDFQGQTLGGITLSLGVAGFPSDGDTADALLRAADEALYQAKRDGRDRIVESGN